MDYLLRLATRSEEVALFKDKWTGRSRRSQLVFVCCASVFVPVFMQTEWISLEISALLLTLLLGLTLPYRPPVVLATLAFPYVFALRIFVSTDLQAYWLTVPLNLGQYSAAPTPMLWWAFLGRFVLAVVGVYKAPTWEDKLSVALCQALVLKKLYLVESKQRREFFDVQHTKQRDAHAAEVEATLVRNAMRLSFPENPFHDKATEERIARMKQELQIVNTGDISEGLKPFNLPVPRHLATKLRGCKMARYMYHGNPVLVESIPNLEVLESDLDLEWFIRAVQYASQLPKMPGLMRTVGYCLTPCTFVVEELIDHHTVTLKDLILELSAESLKLDWYFCRPLLASLADTLTQMHALGVLHRRVSISTVFLTGSTECVLFPATFHHALPEVRKKFWGTSAWEVAPEAKRSPADYCETSDVWAFCVLAWEMLVGTFAWHVTHFAMPPSVPKRVVDSIIDGLSYHPDGRPTMQELLNVLSQPEKALPSDESLVSRPVFTRVLERLNATPAAGKSLPHTESFRSTKPAATSKPSSGFRVSFADVADDDEEL